MTDDDADADVRDADRTRAQNADRADAQAADRADAQAADRSAAQAADRTQAQTADRADAQNDGADAQIDVAALVDGVLAGEHRALARAITHVEDRAPGYRELVGALHENAGDASVVGITGSPGTGKSTLVDELALAYRERGETVGVIAVDPASPFTGGAVLGDRIRMSSTVGDMDVFVRSMSARGTLGGLSAATADAVTALDAFGKDRIVVETVGAGQNEIDVVRTAESVAVLVQPGTGDAVQTLKAGILEIADCFVVNKADLDGADRTVQELAEMLQLERDVDSIERTGHHGAETAAASAEGSRDDAGDTWTPPVLETVATRGEGVDDVIGALDDHRAYLERTGALAERRRLRFAEEIRTLLRGDVGDLVEDEIRRRGGIDELADAVRRRETSAYAVVEELVGPIEACVSDERPTDRE